MNDRPVPLTVVLAADGSRCANRTPAETPVPLTPRLLP